MARVAIRAAKVEIGLEGAKEENDLLRRRSAQQLLDYERTLLVGCCDVTGAGKHRMHAGGSEAQTKARTQGRLSFPDLAKHALYEQALVFWKGPTDVQRRYSLS